jgi:hypothetical protein
MTLDTIRSDFAFLDDWENRYRYVIELGRGLPPLLEAYRTDRYKVRGCASRVWLATDTFCESCNRVRLTCTGTLYMCLGQDDAADLRTPLRASSDDAPLLDAIDDAISRKPQGHDFVIDRRTKKPAVARHMSVTGGGWAASCHSQATINRSHDDVTSNRFCSRGEEISWPCTQAKSSA